MANIVFADLPCRIRGAIIECDDFHTILLNSRHTEHTETYLHELDHLKNDDLRSDKPATIIEEERHGVR